MEIKIKKLHPDAVIPKRAFDTDVGADLVAVEIESETDTQITYNLGIAIENPSRQIAALIFPRSSICKYDLTLSNSVGVIDPTYRGSLKAVFNKTKGHSSKVYAVGERVCQLVFVPFYNASFLVVEELSETSRAAGGWGSTGK